RSILDDPRYGGTPQARRDLLLRGGLRVHTTLDVHKQAQAEEAVAKVLSRPDRDPTAALVSLEPATGFVRALVGGRDYYGDSPEAKFDLATQGRRPAGSSFKPFVLAAALEKGIPLSRVYDAPDTLRLPLTGRTWVVDNYEGDGGEGPMDLVEATVGSVNTVYAQLILDVGPAAAVATASRMGLTSPLSAYPSAVLGTNDVTPLEMAGAYGTLANRGAAVAPSLVTKVVARDGRVLSEHRPAPNQVLRRETADAEVGVLQRVVERGTGVGARIGRPVAGKTGTGQQWRDAWFVGFTPELVTSVWVGFPDAQRSMVPPATRIRVTGGSWPAQIWQVYTTAALAHVPVAPFPDAPRPLRPATAVATRLGSVVGMPVAQAEQALDRSGFRAVRRPVPNEDYPPGYVVGQAPEAGTDQPGGSAVTLQVSAP
ncbi:MAG: penicillin-binding transpeptidase domain-containing protein, partial [Actinomycetota bacterium]|nr:penicillin-binding transpeptidase domain-containing protein [Actinomycetota bacterium]